ncbi:MAG: hypothetical protein ACJ74H_20380 [Thermoanaerobaculia bacterium]
MSEHDSIHRASISRALTGELAEHPDYEMLEQIVDGTADDVTREIVESHTAACPACDAELRDLAAFAGPARSTWRWVAAAAAIIAMIVAGGFLWKRPRPIERVVVRIPAKRVVVASGYGREEWDLAVRDALARGTIDAPPILRELRPPREVLRSPDSHPATVAMNPAGAVIDSTTPLLTWSARPGRYVVSVYDGFQRVARSSVLRSPQWRVSPPLARGRTYAWQVEVHRGDSVELLSPPPAPPAFIHVLDASSSAALAEARRRFPADHLLQGILQARFGMQQTAVEELRMHIAMHPEVRNAAALAESVARW